MEALDQVVRRETQWEAANSGLPSAGVVAASLHII